jgi:hypothetical protein
LRAAQNSRPVIAIDETNKRVRIDRIVASMRDSSNFGFVGLIGAQFNQYPRSPDFARPLRAAGINVVIGVFYVSGMLAMFPQLTADLQTALDLDVSLFAGEAEGGWMRSCATRPPASSRRSTISSMICPRSGARSGRSCGQFGAQDMQPKTGSRSSTASSTAGGRRHGRSLPHPGRYLCHKIHNFVAKSKRAGVTRIFIGHENINPDNLLAAKKRQNKITDYRNMLLAWKAVGIWTYAGTLSASPTTLPSRCGETSKSLKMVAPPNRYSAVCITTSRRRIYS